MADRMTHVYDILFPSPPALEEIVSISIAVQLWRQEINSYRIKNTLSQLNLEQNILSDNPTPRIPATILLLIKNHVKQVGPSIKQWLNDHFDQNLFNTEILNDFDDFVGDFDGTVHYVNTAHKMMLCERVDQITRFKIACTYCFEDDISRIWPSISSHFNETSDFNDKNRLLSYWLCRLKNQPYKSSRSDTTDRRNIEEQLFRDIYFYFPCWTSFEYFWNRVDVDTQMWYITGCSETFILPRLYYRYLLPKFNQVQLNELLTTKGFQILAGFVCKMISLYSTRYIMAIWTYIKHEISGDNFSPLVRILLPEQHRFWSLGDKSICCKLWNTAPNHLKQHAIRNILLEDCYSLFERYEHFENADNYLSLSDLEHLLIVLTDASVEDRSTFWNKYWRGFMNILLTEQFAHLMSFCFGNDEDRIVQFKLESLSVLENIRKRCSRLLRNMRIMELNKWVDFCWPDEQTRKTIRYTLLVEEFKFNRINLRRISSEFNDFINNAYDDEDLAAQFKIQLLSSRSTIAIVKKVIYYFYSLDASFIDILAPSQQAARELKRLHFVPLLKKKLFVSLASQTDGDEFSNFVSECFGSEDETARFKEALPVDKIVRDVVRYAWNSSNNKALKYNCFLVRFLEWYFNTPQELEDFMSRHADNDVFVQLTTIIE